MEFIMWAFYCCLGIVGPSVVWLGIGWVFGQEFGIGWAFGQEFGPLGEDQCG